jgi:hypothetical protein
MVTGTEILAFATALAVFAAAVLPLYRELHKTRAAAIEAADAAAIVHKIVNQQRTDMLHYQAVLLAAMRAAGMDIPLDASLRPGPRRGDGTEGQQET